MNTFFGKNKLLITATARSTLHTSILIASHLMQVGIIHAINKRHSDLPGLNLVVSFHASVQEIRCQIMPSARAFPLEKLMTALQAYQKNRQQFVNISAYNQVMVLKLTLLQSF